MIRLLKEEDRQVIWEYLLRNEIETTFLHSNIEFGIENHTDERRCADYFGFFDNGLLKGILPFYNLGNCIPHYESEAAIPLFAQLIMERNFECMLGVERLTRPIFLELKENKKALEYRESSYFVNRSFEPYSVDGVEFIDPCGLANDSKVIDFIIQARYKGFHDTVTAEGVKKALNIVNPEEDKVIAVKDGKMVAYANIQAYTNTLSQIGSVYTDEDERGKGYCKAVVSELCKRIVSRNKMPTLIVRKNNTPAVRAYSALGFEHYDNYLFIKFA